jgi:ABC-type transport system involved in multi-copper enzyme maturation permease subunit
LEEAVSEETVIPTTTEKEGSNWLTIIILIIISAVILGLAAWAYKKK